LTDLVEGRGGFAEKLKNAKAPLIIVGSGAVARSDGKAVLANAAKLAVNCGAIKEEWNGFAVLHTAAGRVGGLDICALPTLGSGRPTREILAGAAAGDIEFVYLLGADEIDMASLGRAFVVYQGTHGDAGAHRADVILPGAAYTEKSGTFVNTEGRAQLAYRASYPPGEAREDWAILRALSELLGKKLPWDSLDQLRAELYKVAPHLARINQIMASDPAGLRELADQAGPMSSDAFHSPVRDFYLTNPIARASFTMAECSALRHRSRLQAAE
jgi:NADH-quinone oxidoreductase subunit G